MASNYTKAWTKLRNQRIKQAAHNHEPCCRCGRPIDYQLPGNNPDGPTLDHLHPLAHGGELLAEIELLAPAHMRCNSRHGARMGNRMRAGKAAAKAKESARGKAEANPVSLVHSRTPHSGAGAIDIEAEGLHQSQRDQIVGLAMRKVGWAAWHRTPAQSSWPHHIHGVSMGEPGLSPQAYDQTRDYLAGRNGLASNAPDDGPRDFHYVGITWEGCPAEQAGGEEGQGHDNDQVGRGAHLPVGCVGDGAHQIGGGPGRDPAGPRGPAPRRGGVAGHLGQHRRGGGVMDLRDVLLVLVIVLLVWVLILVL